MRDEEYEAYLKYQSGMEDGRRKEEERSFARIETGGQTQRNRKKEKQNSGKGQRRRISHIRKPIMVVAAAALLLIAMTLTLGGIIVRGLPARHEIFPKAGEAVDPASSDYMTLALFGLDARDGNLIEGNNRSDCMIIASINKKTGRIRLLSLYRDTYLNTWDNVCTKANAAYARGGPQMAVSMINRNFDLNITDYVSIGFLGLADMIDALGGLDLDLTQEEVDYANQYVHDMHLESGTALEQLEWIPETEHLTGIQAVAFCRIRYTQGDDYKRSSRQREVLSALLERVKKAGLPGWKKAFQVFSESGFVSTSLSDEDFLWLISKAMVMEIDDTKGLPDTDLRTTKIVDSQDCVIPLSLTDNAVRLHKFLYNADNYQPSQTVENISSRIKKDADLSEQNGT